jgi:hypothetical protein
MRQVPQDLYDQLVAREESCTIVVSEGPGNASSDNFSIEIIGQGAPGARPHESIDAVVVASLMILAQQTIVSRQVDPARRSVVSVGEFHAETAPNVIAGQARLEGIAPAGSHCCSGALSVGRTYSHTLRTDNAATHRIQRVSFIEHLLSA